MKTTQYDMRSIYKLNIFKIGAVLVILISVGCKKFLEIEAPKTTVNEANVYKADPTAIAVLTGIYAGMITDGPFSGPNGISLLSGLSADELSLTGAVTDTRLIAYYKNQLRTNPNENYGTELWGGGPGTNIFSYLFICNAAIEGLNNSGSLTASVKKQLLGEAKFMRAFFYFYLVNFFGDLPLVLTTNPAVNASLSRSPAQQVYQQIVVDLKEAQQLLSDNFLNKNLQNYAGAPERVRPTKWAATALLARTYLYMADYSNAEVESSKIVNNTIQFSLSEINGVFLKNSVEAIWQLQPVQLGLNTADAVAFILPVTGPNTYINPVYLSTQLLNAFEPDDLRRKGGNWVDSVIVSGNTYFFPTKYKATITSGSVTEYLMMFRLAEQYLIRAEARAQQSNISGAQEDLNRIRTRAGLLGTTVGDKTALLGAILKERQVEMFTELGQRWLDLNRTGNIDAVMNVVTPYKTNGGRWQSYQHLFPVYYNDIRKNPNLSQNPGYLRP